MIVSATEDRSKVMVLASDLLPEPLIRVSGSWLIGTFSADELKDDFEPVIDSKEVETLFHEASAALESNPNLPMAASQDV